MSALPRIKKDSACGPGSIASMLIRTDQGYGGQESWVSVVSWAGRL